MKRVTPRIVVDEANRIGFENTAYIDTWRGFDVFYCYNKSDGVTYSGPPMLLYFKDGVVEAKDIETDVEFLSRD